MVQMLAFDLDQTLLRSDKTMSDYSISVLRRCRERGIHIVFATARPYRTIQSFISLAAPDAVVYHNGAVVHIGSKRIENSIDITDTRRILTSLHMLLPKARLSVEINDTLYANYDVTLHWDNTSAVWTDFSDLPEHDADKIIVGISSVREIETAATVLPDSVYMEMSDDRLGLIMNKNASKFRGVSYVAEAFGLEPEKVAAFGDDYNDIVMLRGFGIGVAVANAIDEVKTVADYITRSNDEDGPAAWIEEHLL